MTLFRIISAAALPVLFSLLFNYLEKRPAWQSRPYALRQTIIGLCFGGLAILSTEFGIPIDGAVLNVRSAPPVAAALLGMSRQLICLIPCLLTLPRFFGVTGLSLSQAAADVLSMALVIPLLLSVLREIKKKEKEEEAPAEEAQVPAG